jgi:hypothetical protein
MAAAVQWLNSATECALVHRNPSRHLGRQPALQTHTHTHRERERETDRQTDRQTDRHTQRQRESVRAACGQLVTVSSGRSARGVRHVVGMQSVEQLFKRAWRGVVLGKEEVRAQACRPTHRPCAAAPHGRIIHLTFTREQ